MEPTDFSPPTDDQPDEVAIGAEPDAATTAKPSKIARLKSSQQKLLDRVEQTRTDLESKRATSSTIDTAMAAIEGDAVVGGPVLAGAVAFRIFLFQVPYVFVVVTLLGWLGSSSDEASDEIGKVVGIGTLTARAIGGASELSGWSLVWSLIAGMGALFLAARTAGKVFRVIHVLIWRIPPVKANYTRGAFGFIGVVTVGLLLSSLAGRVRTETFLGGVLLTLLVNAIFGAAFVLVELRMPRPPDSTWKDMVPGAIIFAIGVLGLHLITVYWISYELDNKSDTYGAIGASLALLLWAYMLGRLLTTAVLVNHVRWQRAHPPLPLPPLPPPPNPT